MALFPEREKAQVPEAIKPIPATPEIPQHLEKAGVTVTPSQFSAQVTDGSSQDLIAPLATTLQAPAAAPTLTLWAKGSIASSLTWFAAFWLRMIKKAFFYANSS